MGVLSERDCWDLLRRHDFGRLGFREGESVAILPINYCVYAPGQLVFRTAPGSKTLAAAFDSDVAFEIDEIGEESAVSVLMRGKARELHGDDALMVDQLPLRPWVDTEKPIVIVIDAESVSGRSFEINRPWLHHH